MASLPSGIHFCINTRPLDILLAQIDSGNGLHLPDLLMIHGPDDLRRHIRLLWLLPLGADCAVDAPMVSISAAVPEGLTMVDSGHRMDCPPDDLDDRDRRAMDLFWKSPRCQSFLGEQMERVRQLLDLALSDSPEDQFLADWFRPRAAATMQAVDTRRPRGVPEEGWV